MSATVTPIDRHNDWPAAVRHLNGTETDFPRDLDEQHTRLIRWFEESERASVDSRERAQRDRAYVDGDQWTTAEREALRARGQPEIIFNYTRRKLDMLRGLERKARTDPKAFPRTPVEEERADAATQALRYVADDNDFSVIRSQVFDEMMVEGFGGAEVQLEDDGKGGANIRLVQVPWDRVWYDPHSRQADFLDARYKGIVIWMDRDQLAEMYPGADEVVDAAFAYSAQDSSQYRDRPEFMVWTDSQRTRVRVVQAHWSEGGTWWQATYTRSGYLAEPMRSKFKDQRGKSACSLILQSAYIDLENNRYGMVRDLISPQDMINKTISKAMHHMAVRQVVAEQGAVQDVDKARREVARPDGYVEVMPGMKFEIESGNDFAQAQMALLQHATQEMQLSGPNAAMSGTDPRELSGRAMLAQQAGGAVQNEPLADGLRMWARRVYEMCWQAAREHWTSGKWVRVTDSLQDTRWVGINRQVTLQDELAAMPEQQRAQVMQQMQLVPGDPRLQQVIRIENDITDLDVDITIGEGQDVPTMAAENFQTLVQLAGMQPGLIPGDVLIAASSLRDKDDLLQRMKAHMQQQQQVQQQVAQKQGAKVDAGIAKDQGQAAANMALAAERKVNAARGVHDIHADFSAPPYGQPNIAPDNPPGATQSPGGNALAPAMMAAHASGGLVTRTMPADTWMGGLPTMSPQARADDTRFREIDPSTYTTDPMTLQYNYPGHTPGQMPPQWWPGPNREAAYVMPPHAQGGPITQMAGPDPPGPDTGFITAKPGEFVLQQSAVARYGPDLLNMLNAGLIDPQNMQMAAAHAQADLAKKQVDIEKVRADADLARAKVSEIPHGNMATRADIAHQMVETNRLARTPIPRPSEQGK